ncbi:hypothetical protein C9439_02310 [archaeon SCG-AAA382B04]|nr:hypothetical protein C9439_02310 [archaeon SCG-AAA382B04]
MIRGEIQVKKFDNILLPTDGSKDSEEALKYAIPIAKKFDSTIHILHVMYRDILYLREQVELTKSLREEVNEEIEKGSLDAYKQVIKSMLKKVEDKGLKAESKILEGVPYKKINEYAKNEEIDLIVMSNRGLGGLERMMMGSTTDKVIRSSEIPVMTVRVG